MMCYNVNCIHYHNQKDSGFQIALLHFIVLVLPIVANKSEVLHIKKHISAFKNNVEYVRMHS